MQFYDISILIFGLSERDGLILDQCAPCRWLSSKMFKVSSRHFVLFTDSCQSGGKCRAFAACASQHRVRSGISCTLGDGSKGLCCNDKTTNPSKINFNTLKLLL